MPLGANTIGGLMELGAIINANACGPTTFSCGTEEYLQSQRSLTMRG